MLLIETELKPSSIAGIGVFLTAPVAKGAVVWRYDGRIDGAIEPSEAADLPKHVQDWLTAHTVWHEETGVHVVWGDNARYLNHASAPNLAFEGPGFADARAVRDIAAGEELTCDYRVICDQTRVDGLRF